MQTGRFWQVDPLAEKYVYNSTYAFSENKVTGDIELEGAEAQAFMPALMARMGSTLVTRPNSGEATAWGAFAGASSALNGVVSGAIGTVQGAATLGNAASNPLAAAQTLQSVESGAEAMSSPTAMMTGTIASTVQEYPGASDNFLTGAVLGNAGTNAALAAAPMLGEFKAASIGFKGANEGGELFNFTKTAAAHMDEPGRMIPIQTLDDIIKAPMAVVKDPRGATNAMMHYSQMWKNGKLYNVEVLYEKPTNTISHFKYATRVLGPLPKIK